MDIAEYKPMVVSYAKHVMRADWVRASGITFEELVNAGMQQMITEASQPRFERIRAKQMELWYIRQAMMRAIKQKSSEITGENS